jgi:hypothetical protein
MEREVLQDECVDTTLRGRTGVNKGKGKSQSHLPTFTLPEKDVKSERIHCQETITTRNVSRSPSGRRTIERWKSLPTESKG